MNTLSLEKKAQIIRLLVEGNSLRSCSRITDTSITTVCRLLVDVGMACWNFHDAHVVNVKCDRVQCDEIWSFVYSKEKNKPEGIENAGDVWTWTGMCADSKLMLSWNIGDRDAGSANYFMHDLASRLASRVQLTTDGHHAYLEAVANNFDEIDYAMLVKLYGKEGDGSKTAEKKYSPAKFTGSKKTVIEGNPKDKFISTSYVERSNLTMRMCMRRFTRLTNAFSKKIENHAYSVALHMVYYNFVRQHQSLRITPAMAAGLTKRFMTIEDIARMIPEPVAIKRGTYNKRTNIRKAEVSNV